MARILNKHLLSLITLLIGANCVVKAGDSLEYNNSLLLNGHFSHPMDLKSPKETKEVKGKKARFQKMRYSGYSRVWALYRNLEKHYDDVPLEGLTLPVYLGPGDGGNEPFLLVRMEANPNPKSWFQLEMFFGDRFLATTTRTDPNGKAANLYRIFQFTGSTFTNAGTFKLTAGGGVNWFKLSPFTMWNYQYRDDMFERYPWEPEGNDWGRYESFYSVGDIPRDQRWGNRGTQGFILEGSGLPGGFNASILYGKNENSGGFQSYLSAVPSNMLSGRIDRRFGAHQFGMTYFDQYGYFDSPVAGQPTTEQYNTYTVGGQNYRINDNRLSQKIITLDGRLNLDGIRVFTEWGAASYLSGKYFHDDTLRSGATPIPTDTSAEVSTSRFKRAWSELAYIEFDVAKDKFGFPFKLGMYNLGRYAVNNTSTIFNASIEEIKQGPDQPDLNNTTYFDGMVNQIGQMANNRRGIFLKSAGGVGPIKYDFGYETSQEIQNLYGDIRNGARGGGAVGDSATRVGWTNTITWHHQANQLGRSRFAFFQRFAGPYRRAQNMYRRSFSNLAITDTAVNYKKSFVAMELSLKTKVRLFKKELILATYGIFNSVSEKPFAPKFNDDAFLRYQYVELMGFYKLHPKLTILGFLAFEASKGNMRTELADSTGALITDANGNPTYDANGKPLDQRGRGMGIGCDYNFTKRASIHYRHRWYDHRDNNFTSDEFRGQEVTVELKIFF